MRTVAFMAVAVLLGACATRAPDQGQLRAVPVERIFAQQEPMESGGELFVFRDIGLKAGGCPMALLINGEVVAHFRTGESARFVLPEGEHIIGAEPAGGGLCIAGGSSRNRVEVTTILGRGEIKRYRLGVDDGGIRIGPTTIEF